MNNFYKIYEYGKQILNNEKYIITMSKPHHGEITVLDHSLHVAFTALELSEKCYNIDEESLVKICLLHDYFEHNENISKTERIKKGLFHPFESSQKSMDDFNVNEKERNAIIAHMFPITVEIPNSKEAWILTLADKIVAYEELKYPLHSQFTKRFASMSFIIDDRQLTLATNPRIRTYYEK